MMRPPAWRMGIVGATGLFAPTYLHAAMDLDELELRAIAARREGPLAKVAAEYNDPATHTNWQELVERDDIDVVAIVTSNATHHDIAIAALAAGKHVICEKPLANTAVEAFEMAEAASVSGKGHAVGHYMRFAEPIRSVRGLIEQGDIGEVQAVFGRIWQPRAVHEPLQWWMTERECPTGSIGLLGVHLLDLARYLSGSEYATVVAHLPTLMGERPDLGEISRADANRWSEENPQGPPEGTPVGKVTASDFGTVHGEMKSGAIFTFTAGQTTFTRPGPTPDIQVHGSNGSAFVSYGTASGGLPSVALVRGIRREIIDIPVVSHESPRHQNASMFRDYVLPGLRARASGDTHDVAGFNDGLAVARVVDAARKSHELRAWVDVS
jgi:predicted dehydrogenase